MHRYRTIACSLAPLLALLGQLQAQTPSKTPNVTEAALGETNNVHRCGSLFLAGQPKPADIPTLKENGIQRVISLRTDGEIDWNEPAAVESAGMQFTRIPVENPASLTDEVFDQVRSLLRDSGQTPTLLHCASANRVGAVWLTHRVLDQGVPLETAVKEARTIGLSSSALEAKARDYVQRREGEDGKTSVRPGINQDFLKLDLDVAEWVGRFEVESREVFAARHEITKATGLAAGMRVADIGAGTGMFTRLFSQAVGAKGWVFAVDIAPRFIEHINRQAQVDRLSNITAILCPEDSISLPPESIDVAFICDTYHHFEFPMATLRSIHRALRPEGTLIVIDFERIPGKSREFVLNHVRAGKEDFLNEMEAAGFQLEQEVKLDGLQENYFLRLKKR